MTIESVEPHWSLIPIKRHIDRSLRRNENTIYGTNDLIASTEAAIRTSTSAAVAASAYTLTTSSVPEGRTKQRPRETDAITISAVTSRQADRHISALGFLKTFYK